MKKIICAFLSLILLCSCSSRRDVRVVNKGISFKAHILYSENEYVCFGEISKELEFTFTVAEGPISGFTAFYSGENISLSYLGKESKQEYSLLSECLFTPLAEMFLFTEENPYSVTEEDNSYFVKGKTAAGEFMLCVSPAGLPISAQLGLNDFSVEFYDVSVTK